MGIFDAFVADADVRLIGVEAGGRGITAGEHAARFAGGSSGVLQGTRTYVLQDDNGNIELTHSISAGLDYAAVGPEHAWLHDSKRAEYAWIGDDDALAAFQRLAREEGIIPALESAHAVAHAIRIAPWLSRDESPHRQPVGPRRQGRPQRAERARGPAAGGRGAMNRLTTTFARLRQNGRGGLVTYLTAGDPDAARSADLLVAVARAGADVLEVGVPFSDPLADGPVIQRASERALAAGMSLRGVLEIVRTRPPQRRYADRALHLRQPGDSDGADRLRARRRRRRRRRRPDPGLSGRGGGTASQAARRRRAGSDLSHQPDHDRRRASASRRRSAAASST